MNVPTHFNHPTTHMASLCNCPSLLYNNPSILDPQQTNRIDKQDVQNSQFSLYRHVHLHTHVSMSSTYVLFSIWLPVYPPNTSALWWSILVKVCQASGGGLSPVVLWTAHTPAGTVTEQKYESEWTTGPCERLYKYYSIYGCGPVWVWSYHAPDSQRRLDKIMWS